MPLPFSPVCWSHCLALIPRREITHHVFLWASVSLSVHRDPNASPAEVPVSANVAVPGLCPADPLAPGPRGKCCLPHSPAPFSSRHVRGNYPLMRGNYEHSVWPSAQGPWARREGATELDGRIGNKCGSGDFLVDPQPAPLTSHHCPKFGLSRKRISCLGFP